MDPNYAQLNHMLLNHVFFEEFKRLDNLCKDLYAAPQGITNYIDSMKATPWVDHRVIPDWEADLHQLIRLRGIRNRLAHEEGAYMQIECTQKDIDWVKTFYQKILEQTDPLSILYQHSKSKRQATKPSQAASSGIKQQAAGQSSPWPGVLLALLMLAAIAGILLMLYR